MRRLLAPVLAIGLLALLAACSTAKHEGAEVAGPGVDWSTPLHGGRTVFTSGQGGASPAVSQASALSTAQQNLPFKIRQPRFSPSPSKIQFDNPDEVQPADRLLAFVYQLPTYGTVLVEEKVSQFQLSDLQARANDPTNPQGAFQMVSVRGTQGLLISGNGIGRIMWIEDGILFSITGESVSPAGVQTLAASL